MIPMKGAYNAVSPQHVTHEYFMHILAKVMNLPVLPAPVPAFVLRAVFGEMSDIILNGSRVSSEKILNSGYKFRYGSLEDALLHIFGDRIRRPSAVPRYNFKFSDINYFNCLSKNPDNPLFFKIR